MEKEQAQSTLQTLQNRSENTQKAIDNLNAKMTADASSAAQARGLAAHERSRSRRAQHRRKGASLVVTPFEVVGSWVAKNEDGL